MQILAYEYRRLTCEHGFCCDELNKLGLDGWQLIPSTVVVTQGTHPTEDRRVETFTGLMERARDASVVKAEKDKEKADKIAADKAVADKVTADRAKVAAEASAAKVPAAPVLGGGLISQGTPEFRGVDRQNTPVPGVPSPGQPIVSPFAHTVTNSIPAPVSHPIVSPAVSPSVADSRVVNPPIVSPVVNPPKV